jgi:hypothetical protein
MEWTNLADDPQYAGIKKELAEWLPNENAEEGPRAGKPKKAPARPRSKKS